MGKGRKGGRASLRVMMIRGRLSHAGSHAMPPQLAHTARACLPSPSPSPSHAQPLTPIPPPFSLPANRTPPPPKPPTHPNPLTHPTQPQSSVPPFSFLLTHPPFIHPPQLASPSGAVYRVHFPSTRLIFSVLPLPSPPSERAPISSSALPSPPLLSPPLLRPLSLGSRRRRARRTICLLRLARPILTHPSLFSRLDGFSLVPQPYRRGHRVCLDDAKLLPFPCPPSLSLSPSSPAPSPASLRRLARLFLSLISHTDSSRRRIHDPSGLLFIFFCAHLIIMATRLFVSFR